MRRLEHMKLLEVADKNGAVADVDAANTRADPRRFPNGVVCHGGPPIAGGFMLR
jgi:hypothetical protein